MLRIGVKIIQETSQEATSSNIEPLDFEKESNDMYKAINDEKISYGFNMDNYNSLVLNNRLLESDDWDLDSRWENLDYDLIDCILTWLPLPRFFAFRFVCRRWNDILYSPSFTNYAHTYHKLCLGSL
jgi:hypothetical protein